MTLTEKVFQVLSEIYSDKYGCKITIKAKEEKE